MSKPNPKRSAKSSTRKARDIENDESIDRTQSRSAVPPMANKMPDVDTKDENSDKSDSKTDGDAVTTPTEKPKPPSAGTTLREASQKLLGITMRQEWNSIDPVLKQMEKIVAANGETHSNPLTGIKDPVCIFIGVLNWKNHWTVRLQYIHSKVC